MSATIHCGDVRDVLATLPANSVQCVVTSPPYYALRDYGVAGQIGLEPTIAEYLAAMGAVFRDVRRVLRDDGTLWLNIGDSYGAQQGRGFNTNAYTGGTNRVQDMQRASGDIKLDTGLKPKNLMLIPARLALALQDDGWWVRSEIIWAKPNPMPESVQDRPTVAHEHIWLLTKQARYFYDADAIRTPVSAKTLERHSGPLEQRVKHAYVEGIHGHRPHCGTLGQNGGVDPSMGANARTVWDIATSGFAEAHFATFPLEIPRRCILAGTSERGACPACGAPWRRVVERACRELGADYGGKSAEQDAQFSTRRMDKNKRAAREAIGDMGADNPFPAPVTTGWQPTCRCDAGDATVPCVVLDPFSGAGTTGVVALRHGRDYIGIELSPEYAEMSRRRIYGDAPLLNSVEVVAA